MSDNSPFEIFVPTKEDKDHNLEAFKIIYQEYEDEMLSVRCNMKDWTNKYVVLKQKMDGLEKMIKERENEK